MAVATPEAKVRTRATLLLPAEVQDAYERIAAQEKKPLDQVLSERLVDCVNHKANKGLWFGDAERGEIEAAVGSNIRQASDLVGLLRRALAVTVGETRVPLKPDLLARLKSRCFTPPFDQWLGNLVREKLEEYVGLR